MKHLTNDEMKHVRNVIESMFDINEICDFYQIESINNIESIINNVWETRSYIDDIDNRIDCIRHMMFNMCREIYEHFNVD